MVAINHNDWTPEDVLKLRQFVALGMSASQIAAKFPSRHPSRNSVIGKCRRLHLTLGAGKVRRDKSPNRAAAPRAIDPDIDSPRTRKIKAAVANAVARSQQAATTSSVAAQTAVERLGSHTCRWPIGDPSSDEFAFCGKPAERSYCDDHARQAYSPKPGVDVRRIERQAVRSDARGAVYRW